MTNTMRKITSKLTKTPYLVLLTVLIAITVTSAYALTITLGGNVVVTGDTTLLGDMTCPGCVDSADLAPGVVDDADSDPTNELQTILQKRASVQGITVDGFTSQTVSCGTGWIATGGGPGGLDVGESLVASFPSNIESNWIVAFEGSGSVTAWANCIKLQ